jgi:hypothetical protein
VQDKRFAVVFIVPTNTPGVKFICRTSYEMTATAMGSAFDYPLSSRLDENDAVFILDKVLVPWENVFVYGDVEKANNFFPRTGFLPRFVVHGCTRLAVKLDFISGLLLKATEAAGTKDYRGVQANVGEVIAWRNLFWGLSDAMVRDPRPWIDDYLLPNMDPGNAYQIIATMAYSRIKYLIEQTVASALSISIPTPATSRILRSAPIWSNIFAAPTATRPRSGSSFSSFCGTASEANSAAVMSFTRSTTAARPRKSAATPCSAPRPRATRTGSRDLPRNAWPNTGSTGGVSLISAIRANSAITCCARAGDRKPLSHSENLPARDGLPTNGSGLFSRSQERQPTTLGYHHVRPAH